MWVVLQTKLFSPSAEGFWTIGKAYSYFNALNDSSFFSGNMRMWFNRPYIEIALYQAVTYSKRNISSSMQTCCPLSTILVLNNTSCKFHWVAFPLGAFIFLTLISVVLTCFLTSLWACLYASAMEVTQANITVTDVYYLHHNLK